MPKKPRIGIGLGLAGRTGFVNPPMFDPLTLNPYLWCRAEDATVDGSGFISAFDDLAGNGNYLQQATPGLQPQQVSGIPGVAPGVIGAKFDGAGDVVTSFAALGLEAQDFWEIYVVSKYNTAEANEFSIGGNNGGRWYKQSNRAKVRTRDGLGDYEINVLDPVNSPTYALHRTTKVDLTNEPIPIDLRGYEHRTNYGAVNSVEVMEGFFNDFQGSLEYGQHNVVASQFDGWLMDIMLFKRRLTPTEENNLISCYFNRKYNIW